MEIDRRSAATTKMVWVAAFIVHAIVGCASNARHEKPSIKQSDESCTDASVVLSASALPIALQMEAMPRESSVENRGVLARRLAISVAAQSWKRSDRIVWSSLSVRPFGGTLEGWTRLQTDYATIYAAPYKDNRSGVNERHRFEVDTLEVDSGNAVVTRSSIASANLAGTTMLDVLVNPGGVVVDETVLKIPQLWNELGSSLAADSLRPEFAVVRHPPGMDTVEAELKLNYVLLRNNAELRCSTESRVTLVDRDAVRQPFWDIGTSSHNAGRDHWLALWSVEFGAIRAVFDSPAAANALVNWIRSTHSTKIAQFTLGLFNGEPHSLRPAAPVDLNINESFHPLEITDIDRLRVGPLGEP